MTAIPASKSGRRSAVVLRRLRRTALVLLLGFAVVALWPEPPTVCHQEVVRGVVTTLCRPLRLADARAGIYLLLVGLAVLPDLLTYVTRRCSRQLELRALAAKARNLRAELAAARKESAALRELLVLNCDEQRRE